MVFIFRAFIYIFFFILMLIVFLPKENLYYFALDNLKSYKVQVNNSGFKDTYVGMNIKELNIFYNDIDVSDISQVDLKTYLLKSDLIIDDIVVDKSLNRYFPHRIDYVSVTHSIIDPLKIKIDSKFAMGECSGYIDLATKVLKLNIDVSKSFRKKYPMIVKNLKKVDQKADNKGESYTYEYKLK